MNVSAFVGQKVGPYRERAGAARLSGFATAVGAGASPGGDAPPTFITVCRRGEFDLFQKMKIALSRVLHGEQEYEYFTPVRAEAELEYETRLAKAFEKAGASGSMLFLVMETMIRSGGAPVAISRTTVIVRGSEKP